MRAQKCEAAMGPRQLGFEDDIAASFLDTPFRPWRESEAPDQFSKSQSVSEPLAGESSPACARSVRTNDAFVQKVMGRSATVGGGGRRLGGLRLGHGGADTALALLDEPAGDHGVGVFIEPLIEERRNFLAEIGGVAKPGEFIALQGIAGSGEKELPRRRSAAIGHVGLQY